MQKKKNEQPVRLIIFDFDGTLTSASEVFMDAWDAAARTLGESPYRRQEAADLRNVDAKAVLARHEITPERIPAFIERIRQELASRAAQIKVVPGMLDVLARLVSAGHHLALVTSNAHETIAAILGDDLETLFRGSRFEVPLASKADAITEMQTQSGLSQSATVYVGDELRDLSAAHAAGVAFIGVSWGFNSTEALSNAGCTFIAHDVEELEQVLCLH